eukprot:3562299-Pleurochrysis_carterae.AAC.1
MVFARERSRQGDYPRRAGSGYSCCAKRKQRPDGISRTRAIEHADSDSNAPEEGPVAEAPEDSSDDEDAEPGRARTASGPPNHEGGMVDGQGGQWERYDEFATDQRATPRLSTVCKTAAGRAKHKNGLPECANWAVSIDDLMQWQGA